MAQVIYKVLLSLPGHEALAQMSAKSVAPERTTIFETAFVVESLSLAQHAFRRRAQSLT